MVENRIGRVPVVQDGELKGIVTRTDILASMHGNVYLGASGSGNINIDEKGSEDLARLMEDILPREVLVLVRNLGRLASEQGNRIYLVGGLVRDLLLGVPNLDLVTVQVTASVTSAQMLLPATPPDLYIFDGVLPDRLPPAGNLFFIDPPASTELFAVRDTLTRTQITDVETNSPLLRYVNLGDTRIARARRVLPPPWAQVLVAARAGPLLLAGDAPDGSRCV